MECNKYICIDLKSFYASVECVDRGLDPMTADLVVADSERTDKTICLAVSPSLRKRGIKSRCRVFEIPKNIEYITAPPRMKLYIDYSAKIYGIYQRFICRDDIHVYSIDEAFMDVTHYIKLYNKTPVQIGKMIMDAVFEETGIRGTCGCGDNLYLAKIALDITAKHSPDFIGELTEKSYRDRLWNHKPLTDFWRIGKGTERHLRRLGIYTMEGIAKMNPDILFKSFGVDAELLIDHAWGREPVTLADIKTYKPKNHSLSSGQVLARDYSYDKGKIIVWEMMEQLCLDMVERGLTAESVTLCIGYSRKLEMPPDIGTGVFTVDTNSEILAIPVVTDVYERIADRKSGIRRISITCNGVKKQMEWQETMFLGQEHLARGKSIQDATLKIKKRFGRNALIKGIDLTEGATAMERNVQIGGHRSGE